MGSGVWVQDGARRSDRSDGRRGRKDAQRYRLDGERVWRGGGDEFDTAKIAKRTSVGFHR